jgi:DNA-binding NarL/FixJ family response regulator
LTGKEALTVFQDDDTVHAAIAAKAVGYLLKGGWGGHAGR